MHIYYCTNVTGAQIVLRDINEQHHNGKFFNHLPAPFFSGYVVTKCGAGSPMSWNQTERIFNFAPEGVSISPSTV